MDIAVGEMVFDALVAGDTEAPVVFLLHGFPQSSAQWRFQVPALAAAGYRVVAPDQRGYSPRARPLGVENYRMGHMVDDVVGMADSLGVQRFHVVGHDWGAVVAWNLAAAHGDRLLTLTAISVPHPMAFALALASPTGDQLGRSAYIPVLQSSDAEKLLAGDAIRSLLEAAGHTGDTTEYVAHMARPGALTAALNWYRAVDLAAADIGAITVPTMFVWSTADVALGREAAEGTADFVTGPYRFEVLDGVSHWIPEMAPKRLNRLLVEHLAS